MRKKIESVLLLIITIFLLTSCYITGAYKLRLNENQHMQICAYFSLPINLPPDIKDVTDLNCSLRERDSKGRLMFTLDTYNLATMQDEQYMIICQKIDRDYVYYYEDCSYLTHGFSDLDIETLKAINDWEKPLDDAKMSRRKISLTIDGIINHDPYINDVDVLELCKSELDLSEEDISYFALVDTDGTKNCMYNLIAEQNDEKSIYYIMCNTDSKIAILKLNNNEFQPSDYAEFKQSNGWRYGW